MLIIINTLFRIVSLESKLLNHVQYLRLCRYGILANNEPFILAYRGVLFEPPVLSDVSRSESSIRVCI